MDLAYDVDADGRIVWLSEGWERFALANGWPAGEPTAIIGTRLWDHVSDATLELCLRRIFERVRARRQPVELSCRCDAPGLRRDLRLHVSSADGAIVRATNQVVAETPREVVPATADPDVLLRMCSWCNRIRVGERWMELEAAVEALGLLAGPRAPAISHGVCQECRAALHAVAESN